MLNRISHILKQSFYCLAVVFALTIYYPAPAAAGDTDQIRFATYNIAMGLDSQGEIHDRLQSGNDVSLRKVAAVIQKVRPDVLLLNEFDYQANMHAGRLFVINYLEQPQFGQIPISYPYTLDGPVNTGVDSGLDLDNNGSTSEPADAWGYGAFPGQYGMQVLSRFPLTREAPRTFQNFLWKDMPDAVVPTNPDDSPWYTAEISEQLRLSSKSHRDLSLPVGDQIIHFLISHPTPPAFDGPEDRNGARNFDEIRLWADYVDPQASGYIYDDAGVSGGLPEGAQFVIAGDMNADPVDGESRDNAIGQLLDDPLVNASCEPVSKGAKKAGATQGGKNLEQKGNAAADTADFDDQPVGNLRVDYVLPSANLKVVDCGVFWPLEGQLGFEWIDGSDHRLVWVDVEMGRRPNPE